VNRRRYLRGLSTVAAGVVGGCLSLGADGPEPVPGDRPAAVYRPVRVAPGRSVGTTRAGPFAVAVAVGRPVRFWVPGSGGFDRRPADGDVHLMATVFDPDTRTVFPEAGVTAAVRDEAVGREVVYPMLSQRGGFHYGDNFDLPGAGEYPVEVSVAGLGIRRLGAFAGRFETPASATVTVDTTDLPPVEHPAESGRPGSVGLDRSGPPRGRAPAVADLPGRRLGTTTVGDARYVVVAVDRPRADPALERPGERYLAVSARTPHERLVVPSAGVSATLVDGDGRTIRLRRAVGPDLGYHYGAPVADVDGLDRLRLSVDPAPQVARHEGYETAFVESGEGVVRP
jgi:hypothetical protein